VNKDIYNYYCANSSASLAQWNNFFNHSSSVVLHFPVLRFSVNPEAEAGCSADNGRSYAIITSDAV